MSEAAKAGLEEQVREWAEKNRDELPPAPAPTPNVNAAPAEPAPAVVVVQSTPAEDDDEGPSDTALDMVEIAEFGVGVIDIGLQNFVSPRCAFKPEQTKKLAELGSKVLAKWFPDVEGAIEPEYAFAGAVALFAYTNYRNSPPEPAKAPVTPAGGNENTSGKSGDPSAQVLQ